MGFLITTLLITGALLGIDTLFSLYHFKYTYFLELKRRYASLKTVPKAYRRKLAEQIDQEIGFFRLLVQSSYIPWFICCFWTPLWYLPLVLSVFIVFTNLFYTKPYMPPVVLWINLAVSFSIYCFSILTIISRFV